MKKAQEEAGKALLAFANIVTALVFLKAFWEKKDYGDLAMAVVFWSGLYALGMALIHRSEGVTE